MKRRLKMVHTISTAAILVPALFADVAAGQVALNEVQKLLASDGAESDFFGWDVFVSGDVAMVGAAKNNEEARGAVYAYRFDGSSWNQEQKLLASDGAAEDLYGGSPSVSGDVVVAGALGDDDNGDRSGSAYVHRFDGSSWNEEQKLLPSDGATFDQFGASVSVSGDVILVGSPHDDDLGFASGAAYVYRFDGSSWIEEQKLLPSDGAELDFFGANVSISGDVAVVGAPLDDDDGTDSGSAYVYRFDGASWNQEQKLLSADGAAEDLFGDSVSVSGDVAMIGTYHSGSAHVYRFDGSSWYHEQKLLASDHEEGDLDARSVSVSGDVAVVGALGDDDNGERSGAAYAYRFDGSSWNQERKLLASDGAEGDLCGFSVSVSGDVVVVGAYLDDDNGTNSGSAYVFDIVPCIPEDLNGSGAIDHVDLAAVLEAWGPCDGCIEDMDMSGAVDFGDVLAILRAWGACP